jgi:metal-sulfur cluster biosynthetic enzyme
MNTSCESLAAQIREALRVVIDPELGYNIVDLGFIYDIAVDDGGIARITMTTTTPGCPASGYLKEGAANCAWGVPGVEFVDVVMTFNPEWKPAMMTPQAKTDLGFAEVN